MKRYKVFSFILAVLICVSIFSACSCIYDNQTLNADSNKTEIEVSNLIENCVWTTYSKSFFPFEAGYLVDAIARVDSTIMALGHLGSEFVLCLTEYKLDDCAEISFEEPILIPISHLLSGENHTIYGLTADNTNFYLLESNEAGYRLINCAKDGKLNAVIDLEQLHTAEPYGIAVSQDNSLVLFGAQLEIIDLNTGESTILNLEDEMDYIWSVSSCNRGLVVYSALSGCFLFDTQNNSFTPVDNEMMCISICQGLAGEYLYYDLDSFSTYDFESGESTELLRWSTNNIPGSFAKYICRLGEFAFLCLGGNTDTIMVVGKALRQVVDNKTVNVAILGDDFGTFDRAESRIMAANALDGVYDYVISEYDASQIDRLITEISTDNSPDLILFRKGLDTSSSYFENLYKYLDRDPELSREDFIPGLLTALETRGELHEIWNAVEIDTVGIRESDYDGNEDFTIEYCEKMMARGNYSSVFGSFMSASELLKWIANISTGTYIDKENGSCNFNVEEFGDLLEWCKKMEPGFKTGKESIPFDYETDDILLRIQPITNAEQFSALPEIFGERLVFVGFPSGEGNGSYFANSDVSMAIPVNSSNKNGAWAFIRSQMTAGSQISEVYTMGGFPVNMEALKRTSLQTLNQLEYDQLMKLVNETSKAISYSDDKITSIILECGQDYIAGKKSLEDTMEIIQSRVSILVAEKYG